MMLPLLHHVAKVYGFISICVNLITTLEDKRPVYTNLTLGIKIMSWRLVYQANIYGFFFNSKSIQQQNLLGF